jgi:antitoxin (DNA-binding transcriptional repressor) of toxin-antitoxin stability system
MTIMKKANIAEFKARLSSYLRFVRRGEKVVVYDRDTPIADVVPHDSDTAQQLTITTAQGDLREVWNSRSGAQPNRNFPVGHTDSLSLLLEDRKR